MFLQENVTGRTTVSGTSTTTVITEKWIRVIGEEDFGAIESI